MRLLPEWVREFVDVPVDDRRLADDLTMAGISIEGVFTEDGHTVFDADITTNRVDAMNHYGVARECSAVYERDLKPVRPDVPDGRAKPAFDIRIADGDLCARYTARVVRGVTICQSPETIAQRLALLGARPINNVADATNYALWELGHPTHAFDMDLLQGGKIIVRLAREGETIRTLDAVERRLSRDDLVIADAARPVAIAGVMGGFDTMISERTRNVLIESAWFDPLSVRRTARRLGMHTDASHRFERGADFGITPVACDRVAELIVRSGGGEVAGGLIDVVARNLRRPGLHLRSSEIRRILGQDIPEEEIRRILRRLGFEVLPAAVSGSAVTVRTPAAPAGSGGAHAAVAEGIADFAVGPPSWRLDVEREIDLVEEVARIYGYDRLPSTLPPFSGAVVEQPDAPKDARLRSDLLALGHNEAISLSFVSRLDATVFSNTQPVEIANPLSEEAAYMRTSLLPSMLTMLAYNLNRGSNDVRLFEMAKVYERLGDGAAEYRRACIGATGSVRPGSVHEPARPYTFFDLKGDIERLLGAFDSGSLYFDAHTAEYYHPGQSARAVMDGSTVVQFGQIHPRVAAERKLKQDIFVAEIDLERLYKHPLREARYAPIPRYPAVDRDFSFIFEDAVTFDRIHVAVEAVRLNELRSFQPVEIFRGVAIGRGKYSILLRAEFQSAERTLRDEEVALWSEQITKALQAIGGVHRA